MGKIIDSVASDISASSLLRHSDDESSDMLPIQHLACCNQAASYLSALQPSCRAAAVQGLFLTSSDHILSQWFADTTAAMAIEGQRRSDRSPLIDYTRSFIGKHPAVIEDMVNHFLYALELTENDISDAFRQLAAAIVAQYRLACWNAERESLAGSNASS